MEKVTRRVENASPTPVRGTAERAGAVLRCLPLVGLLGLAAAQAWLETGSFAARDWLLYAIVGTLLLAAVLVSGAAVAPPRLAAAGVGAQLALAGWYAVSLTWSAVPSKARDDALLAIFYAVVLATPLVLLRGRRDRHFATTALVLGLSAIAVATAAYLRYADDPEGLYYGGRLYFPVSYPNGEAALALVGVWPAIALAATRSAPVVVRALALGGAQAMLGCWLLTQSKGGAVSLAVAAIVFFVVTNARVRALVPTLVVGALTIPAFEPLTEPFRAPPWEFDAAVRDAGTTAVALAAVAAAAGLLYALVDRRLAVPPRATRVAGGVALAALAAAVATGMGAFLTSVDRPGDYLQDKWEAFKHLPEERTASTHLLSLGSNRYDFWRVSFDAFAEHPVAGVGSRGFGPLYLQAGRSHEVPQHAHSLGLEELAENGFVGFVLLCAAIGLPLTVAVRRARRSLTVAGLVGGAAYWITHASGDWNWALPAVGIPFFLLLGIASAGDDGRPLRPRVAYAAAAAAALLALLVLAPPWVAARYVADAYAHPRNADAALRRARSLDPLSTEPLIAEAVLKQSVPALEEVVRREPRREEHRIALAQTYLAFGRKADARRQLQVARELFPRDGRIRVLLRRAR